MEKNNLSQLFSDNGKEISQNIIYELLELQGDFIHGFDNFKNIKVIVCCINFLGNVMYLHGDRTSVCECSMATMFGKELTILIVYTFIMMDKTQLQVNVSGYTELQIVAQTLNNNYYN